MHDSKIQLQTSGISQGECSSSMLVNFFLYHYECNYKNNNLQIYKHINEIILIFIHNANFLLPVKYAAYLKLACTILYNNLIHFFRFKHIFAQE